MTYYSNGKLLLTGEYLVLHGAKALAFPVKYGQDLKVSPISNSRGNLIWTAKEQGQVWFEATLKLSTFEVVKSDSDEKAKYLSQILQSARILNPEFLKSEEGLCVETNTNFPIDWGLGTSSTLINNIAKWASVDPFMLHSEVSKGSGYDIACAEANKPILYQLAIEEKPLVEEVNFNKPFLDNLYFVFSGRKKSTERHISKFVANSEDYKDKIIQIDTITEQIIETPEFSEFVSLIKIHEQIIGGLLQQKTIQEKKFIDFKGVVKSLGAWGGDFMLAASDKGPEYIQDYFEQFGLSVIIPFRKMILS